ncbi:hypothetical protein PAMP_018921 [Pampus punctatissimus]
MLIRGHQILTWSCPIRPLLLLRESHLTAFSEHTARELKERKYERSSLSAETVSCSAQLPFFSLDCGNHELREASFQNLTSKCILSSHQSPPLASASGKSKLVSKPWRCTVVEDFAQNLKTVITYQDCLTSTTCLQPWRRPWDIYQHLHSFTNKTQCTYLQSNLSYRQHFAAPHAADTWRECLSLKNENRCRLSLGPNLKLCEVEKERKGASQSQRKDQGKWASVLVSLCSVEGEPAFLFTLRSSTLKGRHKGDVSFAGGKSDPSDRDVVATALREAWEELGVNVATDQVWGVLKPLRDMSGMMVAPVLANLGPLEDLSFKPNPGEVEEIFTLSLSHLCNPHNRGYTHFRTGDKYGYTLPVFRNGKHRVWGLTAVALDQTLKLIVPS